MNIIQKIIQFLLQALGLVKKQADVIAPVPRETVSYKTPVSPDEPLKEDKPLTIEPTNADKLCAVAISYLGTDASPKDKVSDEVGCSETVSNITHEVFPDFPAEVLATDVLNNLLKNSSHFKAELEPSRGAIVISPRTAKQYGHVGIFGDNGLIMSNNSKTGLFEANYNWDTWIKTFGVEGRGLHTYIYRPV